MLSDVYGITGQEKDMNTVTNSTYLLIMASTTPVITHDQHEYITHLKFTVH